MPYPHEDRRDYDRRLVHIESICTKHTTDVALIQQDIKGLMEDQTRLRHTIEVGIITFITTITTVLGILISSGKI